ncbi:MAG: glutathione S-transferase family protein [Pseudomonadota bacterium]
MPYTLYNRPGSGGFACEAAFELAGQSYELVSLDSLPSTPIPEEFRKVNPWGQVPTLITPDRTMVTETAAILIYVAGKWPGPETGPEPWTDAHASLMRWTIFLTANVYEGILRFAYPERYTTDPDGKRSLLEAQAARNQLAFELLEAELTHKPFLLGDTMSVADVYMAMVHGWHGKRDNLPRCAELTYAVARHPVVNPVWKRNFKARRNAFWGEPEG